MNSKKSQITLFIVLGVVLIILVGLVMFFRGYAAKRQIQREVTLVQQESERSKPIRAFVEQCLEKQTKEGILLLGKQGGYIFKTDDGTQKGLTEMVGVENTDYAKDTSGSTAVYIPFFIKESGAVLFPLQPLQGTSRSVANQLEFFLNTTVAECADFSTFQLQGIRVTPQKKDVAVQINENSVAVDFTYPLEAEYIKTGQKELIQGFSTSIAVRLKPSYELANAALQFIREDPLHHQPVNEGSLKNALLPVTPPNMDISVENGASTAYDIIRVSDTDSRYIVAGESLSFSFGKDNWEVS